MRDELYERREQTQVKHYILRHYLERFAHIVTHRWDSITYVDGFAGPWNAQSSDLSDSSFSIALQELRKARGTRRHADKDLRLRCFFLEQNRDSYQRLKEFTSKVQDAEIEVRNSSFEDSIGSILEFIRRDQQTFPFVFIDPTGWTGFALRTISPLLQLNPGEILINFMTGHIRRFLNEEHSRQSFHNLFGSSRFRDRILGLSGRELEDAAVAEYMGSLKRAGNFQYVLSALVLHPEIARTHFNLIYATHHPKGAEVFKETEKRAMQEMERIRERAQRRRREERTRQHEILFESGSAPQSQHYIALRGHYLQLARESLLGQLRQQKRISYSDAWAHSLEASLVWESDLKDWIREWQEGGHLRIEGLVGQERVPKRERSHFLIWQG